MLIGPVTHRRGLQRVGEELRRRNNVLSDVRFFQGTGDPWLEVERYYVRGAGER